MATKIYTKTGDKGQTSLIGGTRVPKNHYRIEAYGTVDELNCWIGMLRDQQIGEHYKTELTEIQDRLFTIGSSLAADPEKSKMILPELLDADVLNLEKAMDAMNLNLPEMRSFVLPGGHPIVSTCHLARTVCRRAERCVVHLSGLEPVNEIVIRYLNRLSDFLFVLSRQLTKDLNAIETPWKPRV